MLEPSLYELSVRGCVLLCVRACVLLDPILQTNGRNPMVDDAVGGTNKLNRF